MKAGRVTQLAIARRAGTSGSLVSRILNNKLHHISVSEETVQRVKRVAHELGYREEQL